MKYWFILCNITLFISCGQPSKGQQERANSQVNKDAKTVVNRFPPPKGFNIQLSEQHSFAYFLQHLPLKPHGELVTYYNGKKKPKGAYQAVIDLPIGNRDLHQCADAIIRLRADYLKSVGRENDIAFHFTNGFLCDYKTWKSGKQPKVEGNQVKWVNGNIHKNNDWKYLEMIFAYAGTLSLEKELKPKPIDEIAIGDVLIQGGSPGHAIIVINKAENDIGETIVMFAQSYLPAQELQILNLPNSNQVWYPISNNEVIQTPEWTFYSNNLKSF